ncbi:hypothetical protein [Dyella sp. 20L07]|uniref:hypothetical protein n=1 Tax=Dyella sp. 20L07 TaxID=3384240 RepID=UPI003D2CDD5E
MAYKSSRRVDLGAVARAPFNAMQWRLLLLWVLLSLLPTLVAALPLLQSLGGLLDHSTHASAWAREFNMMMFGDVAQALGQQRNTLHGALLVSLLLMLLLLPWLNGMAIASGRAGRALGFGGLLQGGLVEYWRMFRLQLWSLPVYALAAYLAQLGFDRADDHADLAVLESQATAAQHLAWWFTGLVVVIAQLWLESARAAFIADSGLRAATVAMWRGLNQLLRRPFSTLLTYLVISAVGFAIVLALGLARIHTLAVGTEGLLLAFLLSQLIVMTFGWMRIARLFALADIARSLGGSRRSGLM